MQVKDEKREKMKQKNRRLNIKVGAQRETDLSLFAYLRSWARQPFSLKGNGGEQWLTDGEDQWWAQHKVIIMILQYYVQRELGSLLSLTDPL